MTGSFSDPITKLIVLLPAEEGAPGPGEAGDGWPGAAGAVGLAVGEQATAIMSARLAAKGKMSFLFKFLLLLYSVLEKSILSGISVLIRRRRMQ